MDLRHPGTAGLMPIKGTTCGARPDLDAMSSDVSFDFSAALALYNAAVEEKIVPANAIKLPASAEITAPRSETDLFKP